MLSYTLCISRKVKKSESKSQRTACEYDKSEGCVYPVKLKNLKANHNLDKIHWIIGLGCVYPVKLKNLKANHNRCYHIFTHLLVVYIRKVKKSESKSQRPCPLEFFDTGLCISVKLKNLKANHN